MQSTCPRADGLAATLWQRVLAEPRITPYVGAQVTALDGDSVRIARAGSEQVLAPRLLLAADGARSTLREHLGVKVDTFPTGHHALATLVRTQQPHSAVARQRFLATGPLALLPSPLGDVVSIVWSAPQRRVGRSQQHILDRGLHAPSGNAVTGMVRSA